jgi:hypothetical protein
LLHAQLALLIIVTSLIVAQPVWSEDAQKVDPAANRDNRLLRGSVEDAEQRKLQGSTNESTLRISRPSADLNGEQALRAKTPTNSPSIPVLGVSQPQPSVRNVDQGNRQPLGLNVNQSNRPPLGLLGMYLLCSENAGSPFYITNVFPPSQLNQYGIQPGDLLIQINGGSPFAYLRTAHPVTPGDTITLKFEHLGIARTVSAQLLDMRQFSPFLGAYSQWAQGHVSFLKEHHDQYRSCALF